MTINISLPEAGPNLSPTITVMGVGGAGGNAVNNMIRSNLEGVDFLIANTDAQALGNSSCERKIQLGLKSTKGLGAGMRPDIGRQAAEEVIDEIKTKLNGSHMVFIAAGMGGGTGTGAAPVIAQLARENGILTVGVVTKPFHFEGSQRMKLAEGGIEELQQQVDTLITIPNQNLFRIANEKTTFSDAFKMADDILYAGVRGVTDLMVQPGLINLDFSDIKTVMSEMGKAMMGTGEAEGEGRAVAAAEAAIANPLIDDVSLKGAKGLIINITGGTDITLYEVDEAANRVKQEVQEEANIIYGTTCDDRLEGIIRVSIVATGIDINSSTNFNKFEHQTKLSIDNSVYQQQNVAQINNATMQSNLSDKNSSTENIENIIQSQKSSFEDTSTDKNEEHLSSISHESKDDGMEEEKPSFSSFNNEDSFIEEDEKHSIDEDEKHTEALSNEENLNENNASIDETGNRASVRRLSLFDTLDESSSELNDNSTSKEIDSKNEPVLENHDEIDGESSEGSVSNEFEPEDGISDEDINQEQEEELLDIPTFLRRQAN
jgi:cell division protein FtsZ